MIITILFSILRDCLKFLGSLFLFFFNFDQKIDFLKSFEVLSIRGGSESSSVSICSEIFENELRLCKILM